MTDPDTADRTYIGPMTPELVEQILEKVCVHGEEGQGGRGFGASYLVTDNETINDNKTIKNESTSSKLPVSCPRSCVLP
jgi:hypothetical protein